MFVFLYALNKTADNKRTCNAVVLYIRQATEPPLTLPSVQETTLKIYENLKDDWGDSDVKGTEQFAGFKTKNVAVW
jgi:hypothetical protein